MDFQAHNSRNRPITRLIVNADDFGYFDQVSRGILEAIEAGAVTATGVMANGPALETWADRLRASGASVGVHLNASLGVPLTAAMQDMIDGPFPSKGAMGLAVVRGRISRAVLLGEWRAQIARCHALGLTLQFVNSHEHLHVMPGLLSAVRALAAEFGIRHVRAPRPEWGPGWSLAGGLRNAVFLAAQCAARSAADEPALIGVSPSGRLDLAYCRWRFARLRAGGSYELMCHPGHADPVALANPALAQYHDWEGELRTVMSPDFRQLLSDRRIELTTYA